MILSLFLFFYISSVTFRIQEYKFNGCTVLLESMKTELGSSNQELPPTERGEWGGHFINSSLPLPSALETLRHLPGTYRRQLTSAHSHQLDLNLEPLVSKCKSLKWGSQKIAKAKCVSFTHNLPSWYYAIF